MSEITDYLENFDPQIAGLIKKEESRQEYGLELIPSENYPSKAVKIAESSVLIEKYSEGYPGKKYYGGNQYAEEVERLAIERAKKLFGAEHANVQPHAGSPANMAAYKALINHGDTILAMDLAHGGHLTHGSPVNFSGQWYKIASYGVSKKDERIDYDNVLKLAKEHKPKLIQAGATAYPREIDFKRFREIADEAGAYFLVDMAHIAGLIVAGMHMSPVPYADIVTSTTHKTLRGPRGGILLCREEHAEKVDKAVFPGLQGGPFMHTIAAKAICFKEASDPRFKKYGQQIVANARALAGTLNENGYRLVSGGTDNHLMLLDTMGAGTTGKEAQAILEQAGIAVNKNMIPFDTQKPFVTSGIRLGTPSITTRKMNEGEMEEIAGMILRALKNKSKPEELQKIRAEAANLCKKFPIPDKPW